MHFLHLISYYKFRTFKETRKHISASHVEKPTAQPPIDYGWWSTNSALICLRALDYVALSKLPPICICTIQAVSLEHIPSLFFIQISFQNHQMAMHQAKTPHQLVRKVAAYNPKSFHFHGLRAFAIKYWKR